MTDNFVLMDEAGNILAEKLIVYHIKVLLDEMKPEPGRRFIVKSTVTGYKLEVTDSTTPADWREFEFQSGMALD